MIELVTYKVRPKNGDKRLRVFRILMKVDTSDSFKVQHNEVLDYFGRVFPFGFYLNSYERRVLDYTVVKNPGLTGYRYFVLEQFDHDYLAQYLNSSDSENK